MDAVLSSQVRRNIAEALAEDVGAGDWTTRYCVDGGTQAEARIIARSPGIIAGLEAAAEVFRQLGGTELKPGLATGDRVAAGAEVARVVGAARDILTGERVALNFLGHLSGVATLTRRFVDAIQGTQTRVTDTRKTTPLWRELERAASRAGGAVNHRSGLDEMILIKDNHLVCTGSAAAAIARVRASNDRKLKVEIETKDLDEVREVLAAGVDRIMLDNMDPATARAAVEIIRADGSKVEIEASGGITLDTVLAYAEAGVDYVSVGALTHSAPTLDLTLLLTVLP